MYSYRTYYHNHLPFLHIIRVLHSVAINMYMCVRVCVYVRACSFIVHNHIRFHLIDREREGACRRSSLTGLLILWKFSLSLSISLSAQLTMPQGCSIPRDSRTPCFVFNSSEASKSKKIKQPNNFHPPHYPEVGCCKISTLKRIYLVWSGCTKALCFQRHRVQVKLDCTHRYLAN